MSIKIAKGIELLKDIPGEGAAAEKGTVVTYNARFFLRKGDEVTRDAQSIAAYRSYLTIRTIDGVELIDHTTTLGKRQSIAGVEKSLYGMQAGGYREVLVSAHLGYGAVGVTDIVPPNAMLRIQLWVHAVQAAD
jgi:FKBP-type peptidyl-prolyl cis-trans isomerase 2